MASAGGAAPLSQAKTTPAPETQSKSGAPADGKGGFARGGDLKKTGSQPQQTQKEGIVFKGRPPQFKKSEHVGNKGEFPELGLGASQSEPVQSKAQIGGPIG